MPPNQIPTAEQLALVSVSAPEQPLARTDGTGFASSALGLFGVPWLLCQKEEECYS